MESTTERWRREATRCRNSLKKTSRRRRTVHEITCRLQRRTCHRFGLLSDCVSDCDLDWCRAFDPAIEDTCCCVCQELMKDLTSAPLQSVPIPECRSGPSPQTNMCMPTANAQTWTDLQILTTCLVESVLVFAVGMLKDLRDKRSALGRHTGLLCCLGRCTPSTGSRAFARSWTRSSLAA